MQQLQVTIQIEELICHKQGRMKGWRKTAPYLWNIFFKICNPHIKVTQKFKLYGNAKFHFSEGSHGNLNTSHMEAGQVASVPAEVGEWTASLGYIDIPFFNYETPGVIGVVTALMEQHNVSNRGAEAGHRSLNDYVKNSMNGALNDFDIAKINVKDIEGSIKEYFESELNKFTQGIEQQVGGAVIKAQNIVQNIWSLLDKDELIGYKIWHFNSEDIIENGYEIPLSQTFSSFAHGEWEIKGNMKALPK